MLSRNDTITLGQQASSPFDIVTSAGITSFPATPAASLSLTANGGIGTAAGTGYHRPESLASA